MPGLVRSERRLAAMKIHGTDAKVDAVLDMLRPTLR